MTAKKLTVSQLSQTHIFNIIIYIYIILINMTDMTVNTYLLYVSEWKFFLSNIFLYIFFLLSYLSYCHITFNYKYIDCHAGPFQLSQLSQNKGQNGTL